MAKPRYLNTTVHLPPGDNRSEAEVLTAGTKLNAAQVKELREGGWKDDREDLWGERLEDDDEPETARVVAPADDPAQDEGQAAEVKADAEKAAAKKR